MKEGLTNRSSFRDQDKPKTGKKGQRGQAEGRASKRGLGSPIFNDRKKPGRQKQTAQTKVEVAKRERSGKK